MMKPNDAISVPATVTIRHPNLLVRALAIGPKHTLKMLIINYNVHPGFILARVIRVKNENGRKFTRKK